MLLKNKLERLKLFTEMDVRDSKLKKEILSRISRDLQDENIFDVNYYISHYNEYGILGKTHLETMQISKYWSHNSNVVSAVCKFKRGLKK
tara:strand:+ start:1606 stop:1875 length:270 start_codon:yes stop_codon:yes gene_type:complete